ncbi:hypothetical protein HK097_000346 [Rhizophlyctis rosea]|uniref:Uncharacterized protein n=1 Tax=Rhizophlyctis rosea TaxID=64517 RepID=A0AAD5S868_9FUNG|nr:hypothetical protein HK097_000346 [Rhizophlyctis rosea]
MKLLLGVAIATKYALRGHNPRHQSEFTRLLPKHTSPSYRSSLVDLNAASSSSLPTTTTTTKTESPTDTSSPRPSSTTPPNPPKLKSLSRVLDQSLSESPISPFLTVERSSLYRRSQSLHLLPVKSQPEGMVINVPLDVIHRISAYVKRQRQEHLIDVEDNPSINGAIGSMIDAVTKFEQILYVPVPKSYDVHLKQILLLYFLALPFQLVKQLGWVLVFVTFVASLAYFGADAIAAEIEEPFGMDQNDLPIDYFCEKLREDIEYIMESQLEVDEDDSETFTDDVENVEPKKDV